MRIIAGKYKGRTLKGPKHEGVRPTADRVKEALFNILGAAVNGAAFLDLFSGTGGVGIEALSRGARNVIFVDQNSRSIKLLRENLKLIGPDEQFRILNLSYERAIEFLEKEAIRFDLAFLDPPFEGGILVDAINQLTQAGLIKDSGIIIAEHPRKMALNITELDGDSRFYGDICLTFLRKRC